MKPSVAVHYVGAKNMKLGNLLLHNLFRFLCDLKIYLHTTANDVDCSSVSTRVDASTLSMVNPI